MQRDYPHQSTMHISAHARTSLPMPQAEPGVKAELVLATLLESQMDKLLQQQQANQAAPTTGRPRCAQHNTQPQAAVTAPLPAPHDAYLVNVCLYIRTHRYAMYIGMIQQCMLLCFCMILHGLGVCTITLVYTTYALLVRTGRCTFSIVSPPANHQVTMAQAPSTSQCPRPRGTRHSLDSGQAGGLAGTLCCRGPHPSSPPLGCAQ